MISCERCEELINARLDGYLTGEESLLLEEHLSQCPDCRKLDRDLTALQERLQKLSFDPPEALTASVMAQIPQPVKKKKRPWAAIACAAAAALLVVTLSPQLLPFGSYGADTEAAEAAEAPTTADTAGGAAPAERADQEESLAEPETGDLKLDTMTEAQAMACLVDYLAGQDLSLTIDPGIPSENGRFWNFSAHDPVSGQTFLYMVDCTKGLVEEGPLP